MQKDYQIQDIVQLVMKQGIRKYKFKNSKIRPIGTAAEGNKGAVFGFRSKESMTEGLGVVLTSEEALWENEDCFSHWTPNTYSYGTYADPNRTIVKGHSEENLKQINTFVIDFDHVAGEELSYNAIMDAAIDLDLIPTLILKTPNGFQAYFILEKAWFISSANGYQSIEIAKLVSKNLRNAFAEVLPAQVVDQGCNHFGIARIPRNDNIMYFYPALVKDMQQLIAWSINYQPEIKRVSKAKLQLLPDSEDRRQVKEKWVDLLVNSSKIFGTKGKKGRNNAIFTLALAYYASDMDQSKCQDDMDEFNSHRLKYPLKDSEVKRIVKSAYSGRYRGANKEYVLELLANWSVESFSEDQLFTQHYKNWYKFKKDRSERKKSHVHEWKEDILAYLEKECYRYRPEIEIKKADLQAAVVYRGGTKDKMIPKRSLDRALKELQTEGKLYLKVKAGRGGGLIVATRKALIRTVIVVKQQVKGAYKGYIRTFFKEAAILTKMVENPAIAEKRDVLEAQLSLWDTG
ncbi:primase C-terminal domain-containing protein [uncultured Enterococcus sp.]|uniref:primase C-terminal domain-containing protein n=1 Tax=uncultured Enterococcus sp. TaxID=167972 RepID=UPI002AA83303|nr:primase C-terminal domain-containing protein [uncultured Enterococcus sp.]